MHAETVLMSLRSFLREVSCALHEGRPAERHSGMAQGSWRR